MTFHYERSASMERPELVDGHSSKSVAYIRRNVHEVTKCNEMLGADVTEYEYEECKVKKADFVENIGEVIWEIMHNGASV